MSYAEHRALVVGAAGLDLKVQPRTAVIEPERSNPGLIRWGRGAWPAILRRTWRAFRLRSS